MDKKAVDRMDILLVIEAVIIVLAIEIGIWYLFNGMPAKADVTPDFLRGLGGPGSDDHGATCIRRMVDGGPVVQFGE